MISTARYPLKYEPLWFIGLGILTSVFALFTFFGWASPEEPEEFLLILFSFTLFFLPLCLALYSVIFVIGRYFIRPRWITLLSATLSPLLVLAFFAFWPHKAIPQPVNQTQPLTSPSGKFVLTLPIEPNNGTAVWKVTIADPFGQILYKDESSQLRGRFGLYWCWDQNDRVWVNYSDDGQVWKWELIEGKWSKSAVSDISQVPENILSNSEKQNANLPKTKNP